MERKTYVTAISKYKYLVLSVGILLFIEKERAMKNLQKQLIYLLFIGCFYPLYLSAYGGKTHVGLSQDAVEKHISSDEGM